jgi:hypothetical protein
MMTTKMMIAFGLVLAAGCIEQEPGDEVELGETESAVQPNLRLEIKSMINTGGQGMCLDIAGGGNVIGTPIVQYPCHRGPNQQWKIQQASLTNFQIQSVADPTRCVGFTGSVVDGTLLRLAACTDSTGLKPSATRFDLVGTDLFDELVSHAALRSVVTPGKCIDVAAGSSAHSLWMQLYRCHGGMNQKWELRHW